MIRDSENYTQAASLGDYEQRTGNEYRLVRSGALRPIPTPRRTLAGDPHIGASAQFANGFRSRGPLLIGSGGDHRIGEREQDAPSSRHGFVAHRAVNQRFFGRRRIAGCRRPAPARRRIVSAIQNDFRAARDRSSRPGQRVAAMPASIASAETPRRVESGHRGERVLHLVLAGQGTVDAHRVRLARTEAAAAGVRARRSSTPHRRLRHGTTRSGGSRRARSRSLPPPAAARQKRRECRASGCRPSLRRSLRGCGRARLRDRNRPA